MSKLKRLIINVISVALSLLALGSCFVGSYMYLQGKNYFGLGDTFSIVFAFFFSLMVFAFSFQGFKEFLYSVFDKDHKK